LKDGEDLFEDSVFFFLCLYITHMIIYKTIVFFLFAPRRLGRQKKFVGKRNIGGAFASLAPQSYACL
jgi:hypothetical protein